MRRKRKEKFGKPFKWLPSGKVFPENIIISFGGTEILVFLPFWV
jgi:hypothetical protein